MSNTTDNIIRIGYGGFVKINNTLCQVTSASINRTYNIPTVTPFYQPFVDTTDSAKTLIRAGYGTCAFSGQVSFQLTTDMLNILFETQTDTYTGFFVKNKKFDFYIYDGMNGVKLPNCMWQSINIQCQPSSLVNCSISFQSDNEGREQIDTYTGNENYDESSYLIPYWQTGAEDMLQFNMTIDRSITPIYLNNNKIGPSYLRPGFIGISLNATYYEPQSTYNKNSEQKLDVRIGNKEITFKSAVLQQNDFRMSSMNDIGEKSYSWKSIPLDHTKPIFTVKSV